MIESAISRREETVPRFITSNIIVRKYVAQASDGAIRVQASFFLGSAHDGHEAVIADEDDFEVADEAEEAVEVRVSM